MFRSVHDWSGRKFGGLYVSGASRGCIGDLGCFSAVIFGCSEYLFIKSLVDFSFCRFGFFEVLDVISGKENENCVECELIT